MAQLNVFQLTSEELNKSIKESKKTTKKNGKTVKESVKRVGGKYAKTKKISANKLRLESLQYVKEADENDEVIDYTPDEDVVLVIDPEMDETPEDVEAAEEAAEELVGDYVCKCSICGANYVCDCNDVNEDLEVEEGECPVCGETGEQIVIGEITPAEAVEDKADEDEEGEEEVDVDVDDEASDDDSDIDVNINIDADGDVDEFDDDEDYAESINRAKRRTSLRRESASKKPARKILPRKPAMRNESRLSAKRPMNRLSAKRPMSNVSNRRTVESRDSKYSLDEATLNRMLTKFAKENYDNVRFVKITDGTIKGNSLTLEGTVVTTKGSKRATRFVCENFKADKTFSAKFTENGVFSENVISKGAGFTINFVTKNNTITPVALRYSYNVKENKEAFNVSGKVMNESMNRSSKLSAKRPTGKRANRK